MTLWCPEFWIHFFFLNHPIGFFSLRLRPLASLEVPSSQFSFYFIFPQNFHLLKLIHLSPLATSSWGAGALSARLCVPPSAWPSIGTINMYRAHKRNTQISVPSQEKKLTLQNESMSSTKTPPELTPPDSGKQGGHWPLRSRASSPSQSKLLSSQPH